MRNCLFFHLSFFSLCYFSSSLDLLISSSDVCSSACDGSSLNPFSSLPQALAAIQNMNESRLQLFFRTSKTETNTYEIRESDLSSFPIDVSTGIRYFQNINIQSLVLLPENCSFDTEGSKCASGDDPLITILNEALILKVSQEMVLFRISIQGGESISNESSSIRNFGLFEIISTNSESNLKIINCTFSNFFLSKTNFLIFVTQNNTINARVLIANSQFKSFSLLNGVIYLESSAFVEFNGTIFEDIKAGFILFTKQNNHQISLKTTIFNISFGVTSLFTLINGTNITINDCLFNGINSTSVYGAILNLDSLNNLTVIHSRVSNISAQSGAFLYGSQFNTLIINSSYFGDCQCIQKGGVVFLQNNNSYLGYNNFYFQNTARMGGVLYSESLNTIESSFSVYQSNNALFVTTDSGIGGAFYLNKNSTIRLKFENFDKQRVDANGAALYSFQSNEISLDSVSFTFGMAGNLGAALFLQLESRLNANNITMIANSAVKKGGAISSDSSNVSITSSYFSLNSAVDGSTFAFDSGNLLNMDTVTVNGSVTNGGQGGVFYFQNWNRITIVNSSFLSSNLNASGIVDIGGIFYFISNNNMNLTNTFISNAAVYSSGGVIYAQKNCSFTISNITVINATVAKEASGVFDFIDSISAQISNLNAFNLNGGRVGGISFLRNFNTLDIKGLTVRNTTAKYGALFYCDQGNILSLEDADVSDAVSSGESGFVGAYTQNSITIKSVSFVNSSAQVSGLSYVISFNNISYENFNISNVSASFSYGTFLGAYTKNQITLQLISIENNYCSGSAGVISLETFNHVWIENLIVNKVTTELFAGLMLIASGNNFTMRTSSFTNIFTKGGSTGAMKIIDQNNIQIYYCNFGNIRTGGHGSGGIFSLSLNNTLVMMFNQYFDFQGPSNGGVVSLAKFNVYNDSFSKFSRISNLNLDTDHHKGAILYSESLNTVNISNCTFTDISSDDSGGIFFLYLLNTLHAQSLEFNNVSVGSVGAILYTQEKNTCVLQGFVAYSIEAKLFGTFFFMLFSNNIKMRNLTATAIYCKGSGGIVYSSDLNNVTFEQITVEYLTVSGSGGFIYAETNNSFEINDLMIRDAWVEGSGGMLFLSRNNQLKISFLVLGVIFSGSRGGVIYGIRSNSIDFSDVQMYWIISLEDGGLFYLVTENKLNILRVELIQSVSYKLDGKIIFLLERNSYAEQDSNLLITWVQEDTLFLFSSSSNTIKLKNETIKFLKLHSFLKVQNGGQVEMNSIKILNDTRWINFVIAIGGSIKIRNLLLNFDIQDVVFDLSGNASVDIRKFQITPSISLLETGFPSGQSPQQQTFNYFIIFSLQDSSLVLKKGTFMNYLTSRLNFITSKNSSIVIKDLFSFGTRIANFSGAWAHLEDSSLRISKSLIINSLSLAGGSIYMVYSNFSNYKQISKTLKEIPQVIRSQENISYDLYSLIMLKNNFKGNTARLEGGVLRFSLPENTINLGFPIILYNNSFELNRAWLGGALSLQNIQVAEIKGNRFAMNKVRNNSYSSENASKFLYAFNESKLANGGAIQSSTSSVIQPSIKIQENIFTQNNAQIGGAVFSISPYLLVNNSFELNSASIFADNAASKVITLVLLTNMTEMLGNDSKNFPKNAQLKNVIPGRSMDYCLLRIAGIDEYQNIIYNSDGEDQYTSQVSFSSSNQANSKYTSHLITSVVKDQVCVQGAYREQLPLVVSFHFDVFFQSNPSNLSIDISFRDCVLGERLTEDFRCLECIPGTYSFEKVFKQTSICEPCTEVHSFVCLGGNRLVPKPGYWRASSDSTNFLKCPKADVCFPYNMTLFEQWEKAQSEGNLTVLAEEQAKMEVLYGFPYYLYTGDCAVGYIGPFCNICAEGYGKLGKLSCIPCNDSSWLYYVLIIIQIILKFFYLFYSVLIAFKMIMATTMQKTSASSVLAMNMLKILVIHVQILNFVTQIPLDLSDNFKTYLPIIFSLSPDISNSFNFECIMRGLGLSISQQYFILILCPVYILFMFMLCLIFVSFRIRKKRDNGMQELSNFQLALCTFYIIMYLTYIDLANVNLEMFQCVNIADDSVPDYRLVNDVSVNCDSLSHVLWKSVLAAPVLSFSIGLVLVMIFKLTLSFFSGTFEEKSNMIQFGYFYYAYKRRFYFWDFVILMRRILILFFFLFFYNELSYRQIFPILLMNLVLYLSLVLQIYMRPFDKEYELINQTEQYSLATLCFSYSVIMMYATFYFNEDAFQTYFFLFPTLLIFLGNVAFFLYWLHIYYVFYFKSKFQTLINKFKQTFLQDAQNMIGRLNTHQHLIFKIQNYLIKRQIVLNDLVDQNDEKNNLMFSDESETMDMESTKIYTELLLKTLKSFPDDVVPDVFEEKMPTPAILTDPNSFVIRLHRKNYRFALFGEEVLLYENSQFKFYFKKELRGRNYFTYQLVQEIAIVSNKKVKIDELAIESKKELNAVVQKESEFQKDDEEAYITPISARIKVFQHSTQHLNLAIKLSETDSNVSVYVIRLPIPLIYFIKFLSMAGFTQFLNTYLYLNESLLTRTYRLKSELACTNIINDIDKIFPHCKRLKSRIVYISKFTGVCSLLTLPNFIFTYSMKINRKAKEVCLEILFVNDEKSTERVEMQRISYKILQGIGFFLTSAYQ